MCVLLAYLRAEISSMNFDVKAQQCHKHGILQFCRMRIIVRLKQHSLDGLHAKIHSNTSL